MKKSKTKKYQSILLSQKVKTNLRIRPNRLSINGLLFLSSRSKSSHWLQLNGFYFSVFTKTIQFLFNWSENKDTGPMLEWHKSTKYFKYIATETEPRLNRSDCHFQIKRLMFFQVSQKQKLTTKYLLSWLQLPLAPVWASSSWY